MVLLHRHLLCILCLAAFLAGGCSQSPKQQLNLFIWSEYIDPGVVADFEKEFNCKVTIDLHEDADTMIAKIAAGGVSSYDIVIPSTRTLRIMVQQGLLAPLRHENIPNLTNIAPQFLNQPFDPGNRYGAPYLWGTGGLYIRRTKGQPIAETWGLIFDPVKQPGPFVMINGVRECLGAALRYKGYSFNSTNLAELGEARDLIIEAKKRSLGFEGGVAAKNRVLSKTAVVAMTWSEILGPKEDPETYYFIPREGGGIYLDLLAIPAKAPHRDLAEKFINYLLDARVGARLADTVGQATANQAALEFINTTDRTNRSIYVSPETMKRLEYAEDLGRFNSVYEEIWTQIKSK